MTTVYLGLGSNLGDREKNLSWALALLSRQTKLARISSIYETDPVSYTQQPLFLNLACQATTPDKPLKLLEKIKAIEWNMGRRESFRNAPRVIDIDILLYGDLVLHSPELTIPHPRMTERAFALLPLEEIAHDLIHPETHKTIEELARQMNHQGIRKWHREK